MKKISKSKLTMFVLWLLVYYIFLYVYCSGQEEVTHDEGSEESGTQYTLDEKYDMIRNGARLILAYDNDNNSFIGTVENTTDKILGGVRVEIHLSNGSEIGPTIPTDLKPGEKIDIKLAATEEKFEKWSAHLEVGNIEHSQGEEGEHGHEEGEEHSQGEIGEHK